MISFNSFRDEMVKIAKDRAAREMDKALRVGDMPKARRMGAAAHGDPGVGQQIAHGLQRSANRHAASMEPVHMGAGGIDPKARSGFGQFEQNIAARQAGSATTPGRLAAQPAAMPTSISVSGMAPAAPAGGGHLVHPEAAQWQQYHQDALAHVKQHGTAASRPTFEQWQASKNAPAAAASHAAPAATAVAHTAPATASSAAKAVSKTPGLFSRLATKVAPAMRMGRLGLGAAGLTTGALGVGAMAAGRAGRAQAQPQPQMQPIPV